MDKLKQNAFWVGLAAAGVVLLGFFVWKVMPLWGEQESLKNQILGRRGGGGTLAALKEAKVPGDPDIKNWIQHRAEMVKSYNAITQFYTDSNTRLERWFEGLPENPAPDSFMTKYRAQKEDVEKKLLEAGIAIGIEEEDAKKRLGFNWDEPTIEEFNQINQRGGAAKVLQVLKELQKRYWARERVALALLNLNLKKDEQGKTRGRVHDFRFFRPLHDNQNLINAPSGANVVYYKGVGAEKASGIPRMFAEYDLPHRLGKTLTFGFAVEMPYSEVPKLLREILNPAVDGPGAQRLLLNIIGTHVTIRAQNQPEEEIRFAKGNDQERRTKEEEIKKKIKPQDVMLTVSCQIIDFEPSEVKDFSKPQTPAQQ